jgi:thioredoxin 1
MPTFLVFKSGKVTETIRGANAGALRAAVTRAASDSGSGGPSGSAFSSKGYRLGNEGEKPKTVGGGAVGTAIGGAGDVADSMVRFMGLYFTTLFSFDAYAAAEASPLSVRGNRK